MAIVSFGIRRGRHPTIADVDTDAKLLYKLFIAPRDSATIYYLRS